MTRFVYLGPEGTFAEQALRRLPESEHGARTAARSVPEALDAVRTEIADAAVVPLENSIGGAVGITLDELATGDPLMITREVVLPVEFVFAARDETPLTTIGTVIAHPQASAQCRGWLRRQVPDATVVDALSNVAAAAEVAEGRHHAAITTPLGASRHRLSVLADAIADHPEAVTRFALVTRAGTPPVPTGDDVTSLAVYISHDRVGALLEVLMELAVRGVNLTRIESRPTGEKLGRYAFFLDCTGHVAEARVGEALQGLRRICAGVRFLGSYPRHRGEPAGERGTRWTGPANGASGIDTEPTAPPEGLSDQDFAEAAAWLEQIRSGALP